MHKPTRELIIDQKKIGFDHPTYFIADISANHDGDLGRAKELIYLAKDSGADAAKFQHFKAETIVSDKGFRSLGLQKSHQASWNKSVFDIYKDASISRDWTEILKETCKSAGITFFTSPYDLELVDYIDQHVPAYKIGSGDITWIEIIEHIASKEKPYILATGASSMDDVDRAVSAGLKINNQLALLQCNTNYTADVENMKYINLNVLKVYREVYPEMILGLSDHTPGHSSVLGAISLGARIVEKHFTDDNARKGPDHLFSMNPSSWRTMVESSRELEAALGGGLKKVEINELETVILQRRSLRVKNNLSKGHVISHSDIDILRPCPVDAIQPYRLNDIVGKKLNHPKSSGDYLKECDLL